MIGGIFVRKVRKFFKKSNKELGILYAFHDAEKAPFSFDFITFMINAELRRRGLGLEKIHVVFVPGPHWHKTLRPEAMARREAHLWRLKHVIIPASGLLPSCAGFTICISRLQAGRLQNRLATHFYPEGYTVSDPRGGHSAIPITNAFRQGREIPLLKVPPFALEEVRKWLRTRAGDRKVVTVSLREASYRPLRNSNLKNWAEFVRALDPSVYYPLFIRDTERAMDSLPAELEGLSVFQEIPWNLELRAALYEIAWLNLFVNNGPDVLCIYNPKTRYIIFKFVTPYYNSTREEFIERHVGITRGQDWPGAGPCQKLVWEDDDPDVIRREFEAMRRRIEAHAEATEMAGV